MKTGLRLSSLLLCALMPAMPVTAQAPAKPEPQIVSLDALQGRSIDVKVTYRGSFRIPGKGTAPGTITQSMRIKIGPGDSVQTTSTRNVAAETPRGVKHGSLSRNLSGKIGTPGKQSDVDFLWMLDGNHLILLRVLEVGGYKTTITFSEGDGSLGCTVDAPYVREAGAGSGRTTSAAFGGKVEILNTKQIASSCKVNKS